MAGPKEIKNLATKRDTLINSLLDKLEGKVQAAQRDLLKTVLDQFVDGMETDEAGNIKNTLANKRRFAMFDNVFNRYVQDKGLEVVKAIADGVGRVIDFNRQYFSVFEKPATLAPIHSNVTETLNAWLGITQRGGIEKNGYLDVLIKDATVKNTVKNIVLKGVVSQTGFNDLKKSLELHIAGSPEQTGALQRYYRNFAYDTYSVSDRTAAKVYADKLKFNYAIYEGGLIETSREFCEEHNGNVYSREEIAKMKPTEAIPPGYNPFTDMGGYGCRHHWNWVPDAVAFAMRPELKAADKPEPTKPEPTTTAAANERNFKANQPFEEIPDFKPTAWKPPADLEKGIAEHGTLETQRQRINEDTAKLSKAVNDLSRQAGKIPWTDAEAHQKIAEQITPLLVKVQEKHNQLRALNERNKQLNEATRQALITGKEPGKVNISIASPTLAKSKEFKAKFAPAQEFYKVASRGYVDDRTITINSARSRAYMSGGNIFVTSKDAERVIVHELGHVLEYNNHVMKAAVDFLDKRTAGQPTKKLRTLNKSYRNDEVYKEGGFYNPYVGKIYTGSRYNGRSYTEVISMGLDRMYTDPLGFRKEDPEHFNLIYSLFFK